MKKIIVITFITFFAFSISCFSQTTIPAVNGGVNDWEKMFDALQKARLDSSINDFAAHTNVQLALVTFGSANTTADKIDLFTDAVDSAFHAKHDTLDLAIFLSKEFRRLIIKAKAPSGATDEQMKQLEVKIQNLFQVATGPHVPLLKEGKFTEALVATIADLKIAVKSL